MNSPTRKPDEGKPPCSVLSYEGANRRAFGAVAGHSEPASELPVRLAEAQRGLNDALAE